jgi:aromatic ring-cleaving dioxygenase
MSLGKIQYFEKFFKIISKPKTPEMTGEDFWIELENWHEKKTGERKYKSYQTFKNEKSKFIAWDRMYRKK